jgi:hypothetical protein
MKRIQLLEISSPGSGAREEAPIWGELAARLRSNLVTEAECRNAVHNHVRASGPNSGPDKGVQWGVSRAGSGCLPDRFDGVTEAAGMSRLGRGVPDHALGRPHIFRRCVGLFRRFNRSPPPHLAALFEGLDWRRVYAPRIRRPQVAGSRRSQAWCRIPIPGS